MKVLWISNVLFPDVCVKLGMPIPNIASWVYSGAMALMQANPKIKLAVAALYPGKELECISSFPVVYYLIPDKGGDAAYNPRIETYYKEITLHFNPDIVHVHGSEYPHSLAYVKACGAKNVILSIQGLVSVVASYYLGGISEKEMKRNITFRDRVRRDSILDQQKKMKKRGQYETELIKSVNHVVGRTLWDKSHVWAINPQARYHYCNETLRPSFYSVQWTYENCRKQSIFLSQAYYPIKGFHKLIEALPIILEHFPDTKVYVAGTNYFSIPKIRKNGFIRYTEKLIKKLGVEKSIVFLGELNENEMLMQYLSAHVFVCPSIIENSSNSIGESQLTGTPCVASYVGGNMDMISDGETGFLYPYEEISVMAKRICEIFGNKELAECLSINERRAASQRHDKAHNASTLNNIYLTMLKDKQNQTE